MEETLGAAFADDPVIRWLVGPDRAGPARAGCLNRSIAHGHLEDGLTMVTPGVEAVAVWAAPSRHSIPVHRFLRYLPRLTRALGGGGLLRIPAMAAVEKLHPPEPHYYLAVLGTHPTHQGRGHASAAMQPVFARADAEGVPCYLESSKEQNVPYYRHHGFEVIDTHDLANGAGPRLWLMWREPQG